ncbi:MAG TPA: pitrilysin family protein [Caulobacteraceae bacterium]|nr:pitrilysin family protein [Caulobacteraceae bacterium]
MAPIVHTLANGARVVCDPMPGLETLALSVVVGRGARHERAEQSGWAHLLEHMVFKAAGDRSARGIVEAVEAEGGHINAATGHDRTSFQVRALKGGAALGMAVISDLVFRPKLDAGDLAKEKRVVGQEIAEAADIPDDLVFEIAAGLAYPDQPLGRPVLGVKATVGAATSPVLADFHRRLYAPDRIVVAAAGAVDADEILKLAERWFGEPAAATPPPDPPPAVFAGGAEARIKRLEQAHLVLLLPAAGLADPDYFAFRLFAELLGGGMSSRLFQEVRETLGLVYAIDAYLEAHADAGVLGVYAGTAARDAAHAAQVAARVLMQLIERLDPGELARAKAQLKGGLFMASESALARAEGAAGQLLVFGRTIPAAETAAAIDAVTAADIARAGARLLAPGRSVTTVLGPKAAQPAAQAFHTALFG